MKIYIDTSVYGGYYDDEFEKPTKELFRRIRSGWFEVIYSDVVDSEVAKAPSNVKRLYALYKKNAIRVAITPQVVALARLYITQKVLPEKMLFDALHIALCSIHGIAYLVSWDEKHIVSPITQIQISQINIENGYENLMLVTPFKLL
jgi:predicted nucleic acid-binding protein